MRISQQKASDIAEKMIEPKKEAIKILADSFKDALINRIERETIPLEVFSLWQNPYVRKYMKACGSVILIGSGFHHETFYLNRTFPHFENSSLVINLEGEEGKKAFEMYSKLQDAKEKASKLKREIQQALLNLKTLKNIRLQFPEALPFLNVEPQNLPALNLTELRNQINTK